MKSALLIKGYGRTNLIVVDSIKHGRVQDKDRLLQCSSAIGAEKKALIVLPEVDSKVIKMQLTTSPALKQLQVNTLNVYDILNADKLIIA